MIASTLDKLALIKGGLITVCPSSETLQYHIEAWLESFSLGNRIPERTFLSQIESIDGTMLNVFIEKFYL